MNKLKRALSLILCAAMLISLLPTIVLAVNNNEKGTCTITTTGGTIYKLVAQPEAGKTYLILNSNAAGSANALSRNGNNIANQTVTVKPADTTSNAVYVADIGSATVWTAGNGLTFMNSDRYLTVTRTTSWNNVTYSLGTGASGSSFTYNTGNKTLSSTVSTGNWWEQTINVYVGYNNGWTANTSSGQVYFYEAVSTSGTATYSLTAENQVVAIDDSIDVAGIAKTVLRNGVAIDAPQGGTYSYEIRSGEDTVLKLENGKLTGVAEGTATVRVKYTWGDNDENVVWADIAVQVSGELFYTVDIKSGGNSANVLSVKGVTNETTRPLTADVLKYGTQTVDGATVAWTSSDTSIVAVNENGLLTFTGKEGIATIFAVYQDGEEEYIDQITVTASTGIYIIPADGTNDFPEYPNEGSIRFDKTAVSVGNFNDTGLAQVELSVTGVPYSKGVDVIVMLDMSSSMTRCINCGLKRNDSGTCGNFKSREDELKDAMQELQNVLQASDNAANIRIAVADFNGTQSFGATQYNANSHTDRTQDVGALTNGGKQKVYTGTVAGEVNSMDASRQRLSAAAFIPVSELNVKNFNYTPSTGTNYDYAFDAVYQLGYAIKQKNIADNDPDRELFVIFMSDGASNQFNYYNTTGGRSGDPGTSDWDKWLTGSIGADRPYSDGKTYTFAEIIECTTHSYYFDEATGNQHRMANAIKGNPNQKYEVIRKNQNLNQGLNSGGNDAVTAILESAGKDNLYWIPGLGATTYTLAFYVVNDGNISGDSAKHSLRGTASSPSHYIEAEQEGAMGEAFKMIAGQIIEAAKDVKITDQMANEYTMVFEAPNEAALEGAPGQEYYIEILDYQLDPNTHERTGSGTSLMKLYMGSTTATDGTIHYHAASDSQGTAYPAPVFEQKALGAMYYWTTEEDIKDSPTYSGVSVTVGDTTYYFDTNGRKQGKDEPIPENWYNMTSGAYASGTITVDDHEGVADGSADDTNYCKDLIIATPHFVYNANEVNGRNKMLYWTLEKIGRNETVMRYFLYLDDSGGYHGSIDQEAGTYPTNEGADLTYTNFQDNRVQQEFPIPQMTWHGAQMSYVFYLVNEQGQPVNRAGRVVPFSEAIYVTDVYTKSVTWSGNDKQEEFQADQLASDIVPDVYTLFDPYAYYNIHVFANENDMARDNHFEIGGTKNVNTTYVFNTKADAEKYSNPGVYAKSGVKVVRCGFCEEGKKDKDYTTRTGFDYYDTVVAFAVLWIPALSPDAVVVDYGLDVVVDVTQNDLAIARPVGLMATPPKDGSGNDVAINSGQFSNPNTVDKLELKIGDKIIATAKMEGNRIRITLDRNNAMHFTNALLFYYVSEVNFYDDHKVLQTVYMYTSVRVIPATTIYYEEDYVRFDADWSLEGTRNASATQAVDRPGPNRVGAGYDADNVYGFDGAYAGCTEYSQNAAMMCQVTALTSTENVQKKSGPTATFSFTGTGFDIIGRTDTKTTSIIVRVDDQDEIFVDTYFEGADGVTAIKQVPVVTVRDLSYGTHNVSVEVVINNDDGSDFAHGETGKFYLDAVRIYEPADHPDYSQDNPVAEAYRLDKEFSPRWEEFGNAVLQRYGAYKAFEYAMFIDRDGEVTEITKYDTWGPNNELYLAAGQAVRLVGDQTFLSNLKKMQGITGMADMQLGIKLASGSEASVTVSNDTSTKTITLNSATDLNFSLRDFYSETITITNNGSGLVALTNLKVTVMPEVATVIDTSDDQSGGKNEDPVIGVPQQRPTEPAEPIPEAPNTLIAQGILMIKQAIAAVIIAVANIMDAVSSGLQRIAEALFAGGG